MAEIEQQDAVVRLQVYRSFLELGRAPLVTELAQVLGVSNSETRASLQRLHQAHLLVLQPSGEILMANPLSAVPTAFPAYLDDGRMFYGNCVWDALGIFAMLDDDGVIRTSCADCGDSLEVRVDGKQAAASSAVALHFALPARRWWDDIVFN